MEKIKFRALSEVQPQLGFKYGYFYEEWNYGHPCRALIRDKNGDIYYINKETLGQYTGLKDKNGKEIYEGDVCFYSDGSGGEIIFESGTFCFKNDNQIKLPLGYFANKIEIKGNIYQNPNLLDNK